MQEITEKQRIPMDKLLCGYSTQPIYTNKKHDRILTACTLDNTKVCEYKINGFKPDCYSGTR